MKLRKLLLLLLSILLLTSCSLLPAASSSSKTITTKKNSGNNSTSGTTITTKTTTERKIISTTDIENLSSDFIMGMDASQVPSLEKSGVTYKDFQGLTQDVFYILSRCHINYVRVRLWNDPYDSEGHGYGGGNCDLDNLINIGKRATRYQMKLLVDFHYSDFWADPGKQKAPKAWANMTLDEKKTALYTYTKETLVRLKDEGIDVGMVQVGNETNTGLCGETSWDNICALMAEGSKAVREVFPDSYVAVHFTEPQNASFMKNIASILDSHNLDYDVFGTSYYPYWHGTISNLTNVLNTIGNTYDKYVMVMETSYANSLDNYDFHGNTSLDTGYNPPHEYSVQGQYDQIYDVIKAISSLDKGLGVCYWEGTWIGVGYTSLEENQVKWETYGSGWASTYSGEYDTDGGLYHGGCPVENQAFFDKNGYVLNSIDVFNQPRNDNNRLKTEVVTSLLTNGSFEESWDLSPWSIKEGEMDTVKIVSTEHHDGERSLNIYNSEKGILKLSYTIHNAHSGTYKFSGYAMGSCEDGGVYLTFYTDDSSRQATILPLNGYGKWGKETLDFTIDETCDLELVIIVWFDAPESWVFIDDLNLICAYYK